MVKSDDISEEEFNSINEVVEETKKTNITEHKERNNKTANIDAMVYTCSEFLDSFIILGYNFNGEPIQPVFYAKNQQQVDALNTYLNKFIASNVGRI